MSLKILACTIIIIVSFNNLKTIRSTFSLYTLTLRLNKKSPD